MGLDKSLQSVDKVMLDLEENHNDMHSLQQSLGTSYTDDEETDWGLELQMLMNEESVVSTPPLCNSIGTRSKTEDARKTEVIEKDAPKTDDARKTEVIEEDASKAEKVSEIIEEYTTEKKAEHAVID
jgi:hypothetical protein